MQELEISNVRELEDLLINDCMYAVRVLPILISQAWNHFGSQGTPVASWG